MSEGYPIDSAVTEARRAISSTYDNLEWATPVLYLRAPTGVLFPKRMSAAVPASAGGLREAISRPAVIVGGIMLCLLSTIVILLVGPLRPPLPPLVPTATTSAALKDVDLVVSSLRFIPANPAPGQRVTVAILLRNTGKSDSGRFKWAWFAWDPRENPTPTLEGEIENLGPGAPLNVKGQFTFDRWGIFRTLAWVNFDNSVLEVPFNNVLQRDISTSNDPLMIDFSVLPNGDEILESRPLGKGDYKAWHFEVAPVTTCNAASAAAAAQIDVDNNVNRLTTGLPGDPTKCNNLPIAFTFDQPIGGASVDFEGTVPGTYAVDLFDAEDKKLSTKTT